MKQFKCENTDLNIEHRKWSKKMSYTSKADIKKKSVSSSAYNTRYFTPIILELMYSIT